VPIPEDEPQEPQQDMEAAGPGSAEERASSFDVDQDAGADLQAEAFDEFSSETQFSEGDQNAEAPQEDDDVVLDAAAGPGETIEFAAPAETESGIAFESMELAGEAVEEEVVEQTIEQEQFAGAADEVNVFGMGGPDDETSEDEDAPAEDEEARPGKRAQRLLAAFSETDPYTVLMGIALFALLLGILFFYLELSAYNFDIGAERAKQLVGALGFPWLR